jgi:hypothetical protein
MKHLGERSSNQITITFFFPNEQFQIFWIALILPFLHYAKHSYYQQPKVMDRPKVKTQNHAASAKTETKGKSDQGDEKELLASRPPRFAAILVKSPLSTLTSHGLLLSIKLQQWFLIMTSNHVLIHLCVLYNFRPVGIPKKTRTSPSPDKGALPKPGPGPSSKQPNARGFIFCTSLSW